MQWILCKSFKHIYSKTWQIALPSAGLMFNVMKARRMLEVVFSQTRNRYPFWAHCQQRRWADRWNLGPLGAVSNHSHLLIENIKGCCLEVIKHLISFQKAFLCYPSNYRWFLFWPLSYEQATSETTAWGCWCWNRPHVSAERKDKISIGWFFLFLLTINHRAERGTFKVTGPY